ncbi:chemotaxis protein CheC [Methanolobus zinderi]|jgi:chemotaxis protein CheC|uniref:Chemotaxis protein CheC n=1 Tax=Methanolobus zinderi TaxID=536044 RepID=A0A7D5I5I4_9EURY|nr:chemotaxis protein CheC [Methanolobus zinderi]QLC50524.1 chemotaxis protein CheC [Methanolobus zinderi]
MAEMDEMAKGAFQEAGNIGMGHLATSLSKMVNREVKIDIPSVEMLSLEDIISKASEGKQKTVVGIHLQLSGDVTGGTLILLPKFSALSFSDLLMKKPIGTTNKIEEMQMRKLREMGVRLCSSYMRVVNEFLGLNLKVGDPTMEVNMEGVSEFIQKEIGELADDFIVVKGECFIPSTNSRNEFNMLFEPEASDVIMAAVMKKMMG